MSEPKLISPMLDNFVMGDPISEHHGVRCCPAMEKETDDKYIVKIISVPASQTQVDAMLLSGAYSSREDALAYFNELSENIIKEAQILNDLSAIEGFTPINSWQIVPMGDATGYDVYLLSPYKNTLEKTLRRGCMTHLSALNLGLDLCAGLAVCRRSGYLYADLKPSNIYLTGENAYRIGDLGFLSLNSLKYTSLPERYRSQYTAPEIADAYSSLNTTIDVYAVGLILYQIFNDGQLPFRDETAPDAEFAPPAYADYEMAEIILKACSADPDSRYQDPVEMGQALVAYMQRNGAHDTPIIPPVETPAEEDPIEKDAEEFSAQEENTQEDTFVETDDNENSPEEITEESIYTEDSEGNLTFIDNDPADETAPDENIEEVDYDEVTEEVSDMLEQADDLIAHETPDPVVQPEPIDVPIPDPIKLEDEESQEDDQASEEDNEEAKSEDSETAETAADDEIVEEAEEETPNKPSHWIRNTILILLALALIVGGIFFYKTFYLQTIESILLETSDDGVLTVLIDSQVAEDKLTVICTDTYGIQLTSPVEDGKAVFTDLMPNSAYTVKVVVAGFHRLTGDTSAAYTTPKQTEIIQFTAVTGSEDGSVILSFAIDGPDCDQWEISYKTADDTTKNVEFAGHMLTLTGLPVGEECTFSLRAKNDMRITGVTHVVHMVSKVVTARNISVSAIVDNTLSVQWVAPKNVTVGSWTVRCYNDSFDKTVVTEETSASFEIPDAAESYTIEIIAAGMSVGERTYVSKNSVGIAEFTIDSKNPDALDISWTVPEGIDTEGWVLEYAINDAAAQKVNIDGKNTISLSPIIPGSEYAICLKTSEGNIVLGSSHYFSSPAAAKFEGYGVTADNMEFKMCRRPSWNNWDRYDISDSDYTTEFSAEDKASFVVRLRHQYDTSYDKITTLFVIRDDSGAIVSTDSQVKSWSDMWYRNYCELDVPEIPSSVGSYTISIYFNGQLAGQTDFTIAE